MTTEHVDLGTQFNVWSVGCDYAGLWFKVFAGGRQNPENLSSDRRSIYNAPFEGLVQVIVEHLLLDHPSPVRSVKL